MILLNLRLTKAKYTVIGILAGLCFLVFAIALAERAEAQRSIGGEIEEIAEIFALVSEVHNELA